MPGCEEDGLCSQASVPLGPATYQPSDVGKSLNYTFLRDSDLLHGAGSEKGKFWWVPTGTR